MSKKANTESLLWQPVTRASQPHVSYEGTGAEDGHGQRGLVRQPHSWPGRTRLF